MKTSIKIIEPVQLIQSNHSLTLNEYRLFQLIIGNIFITDGICARTLYSVSLEDFKKTFSYETEKATYQALTETVAGFKKKWIRVRTTLIDPTASERRETELPYFSRIDYDPDNSRVLIRFSEELTEIFNLISKENFQYAWYYFKHTQKMQSINSIRLFRLVNKWAKVGSWVVELKEFKRLMGFEEGEYEVWSNLKRRVLDSAIGDIREKTNLDVEVFPEKGRCRKVFRLKFEIRFSAGGDGGSAIEGERAGRGAV